MRLVDWFEVKVISHDLNVSKRVFGVEEWIYVKLVFLLTFRAALPEAHPIRAASGDTFAADDVIAGIVRDSQCYAFRLYG